jgi:beta-xylosidase
MLLLSFYWKSFSQTLSFGNQKATMQQTDTMLITGNPIIKDKFTADPTALVYDDTVFIYTGHDEAPVGTEKYVMNDWLCFSSGDMVNWTEYPSPLKATDFTWADGKAYASKVIEHNGEFFWYVAVNHDSAAGSAIGVAKSKNPTGLFVDARGTALVTIDMLPKFVDEKANLDPTVIIDENRQAYMFWGHKICYYAKLKNNLIELDGPINILQLPGFEEGANIHKHNGWYYLSYGYQMPEQVAYAMSRSLDGPWEFKGILNEIAGNCETNRAAILDFKEQSYFIYHNGALENGGSHRRSVCIDYLYYNPDGTMKRVIMTSEGVKRVK